MKRMIDRLAAVRGTVRLDDEVIFSIPIRHTTLDTVTVIGVYETMDEGHPSPIYVGSGTCCHGHLYILKKGKAEEPYELDQIISVNTNVMDIFPISARYILIAGHGCAGAGVSLIDAYYPRSVEVMTSEEYRGLYNEGRDRPLFEVFENDLRVSFFDRNGCTERFKYTRPMGVWRHCHHELTARLKEVSVDVGKMIQSLSHHDYERLLVP